jgi:uncharacterized repeat protein (TIGR01451 family)
MQSFLQLIRVIGLTPRIHRPTLSALTPIIRRQFHPSRSRWATTLLLSSLALSSIEGVLFARSAAAAPTRKDWCGTIWSVENTSTLAWIKPTTGVTTSTSGPTAQITMPGGSMGTSVAAIGIHKESGTMFAFDRNGATGTLYKYQFGVDTTWQAVPISGLIGLAGTQSIPNASNNLNKMTVDGNNLYIADSTAIALYTIPLSATGAVMGNATVGTYAFISDPVGTPAHSTAAINGGDITTDEYGDTYNITYTSTTAYFYKQDPSGAKNWIYQGQTPASAAFAGAAFYKGDLFVKAANQLKTVDLTRSGTGYTGWNNSLVNVGGTSTTSSADLTSCGDPSLVVTKTQQIYTDAAASTLAADQTKVKPGQYLKYLIKIKNIGDSWARSGNLADNLPIGTSYVPNSAVMNGTNLSMATYPTGGFPISSPGLPIGVIPFAPDPDTATLTFVAQVTATTGSVKNRATVTYVDTSGLPAEPPNCTTGLNCGETPTVPIDSPISISGTVFSDADADVVINGNDAGTNAGSASLTIYAIDAMGKVIDKAIVAANGSYSLTNISQNSSVVLRLTNDASIAIGAPAPTVPSLPTGWFQTGKNLDGTIDATIATLGDITLTTTTTAIANQNFGIRQGTIIAPDPATATCNPDYRTALNTGISAAGDSLPEGVNDLNWTVEWIAGPTSGPQTPYALPRPVGPMPARVIGNFAPGAWINEPGNARWISYPFRLSLNGDGDHNDANLNGITSEEFISGGTSDAVRLKYKSSLTLPTNANITLVSVPIGVAVDNQFVSIKVNGVENLIPTPAANPNALDFATLSQLNITQGWQPGVNVIEIITDSGPDLTGFFLSVELASIQVCPNASPNLLLVKRITAINGGTNTVGGDSLSAYIDELTNPYDDNTITIPTKALPTDPPQDTDKWPDPGTFLIGGINGGQIKPNDELEYTIYFLSAGTAEAKNVLFCDRVPSNVSFLPTAFNTGSPAIGGLVGADRGILFNLNSSNLALTNIGDGDGGQFFPAGVDPTTAYPQINCGGPNTNGAVVVKLGDLPDVTAPGVPVNSFGFVRFRAYVK